MSFGMGWKALQLSRLKNRQRCPRCSLQYDKRKARCPYCGDLDSNGLAELKWKIEQDQQANTRLGKLFIYLALLIMIGLLLLNSQT